MPRKITDECLACGTCQGECPVDAISEGDKYSIDPSKCNSNKTHLLPEIA